jgi:hypothetical protein
MFTSYKRGTFAANAAGKALPKMINGSHASPAAGVEKHCSWPNWQ